MRILLLSPPLTEPIVPNLAIELLAELARRSGHSVETLHCALMQPTELSGDAIHALWAPVAFVPYYHGLQADSVVREALDAIHEDFGNGVVDERNRTSVSGMLSKSISLAETCLDRILAAIPFDRYDLVGFSIGCDAQKLPAAAIARLLRIRGDASILVAGGTGLDGPMGAAFLERFNEFDFVLQGEAEVTWPRFVQAIATGREPRDVGGCAYRQDGRVHSSPEIAPPVGPLADVIPNYDSFVAQRARSPYRDSSLFLLFETSRGCWWGANSHCSFCGIRAVQGAFRAMDHDDAFAMITSIYDRYSPDVLYCADAIASTSYLTTLWPMLADARNQGRNWEIFWEVRSTPNYEAMAMMSAAGITQLQPGIETFSSNTLRLMSKGTTAAHQISFLVLAKAHGLSLTYGLIVGTPGESVDDLRAIATLIPNLHHLPAPNDVHELALYRFSPHMNSPAEFGITNVRNYSLQRAIYRCGGELLFRLCYRFNFDVPGNACFEYIQAKQEVIDAIELWKIMYQGGSSLWMQDLDGTALINRVERGKRSVGIVTDHIEASILRLGVRTSTVGTLASKLGVQRSEIRDALARLESRGFIFVDADRIVSLPVVRNERFDATGAGQRRSP